GRVADRLGVGRRQFLAALHLRLCLLFSVRRRADAARRGGVGASLAGLDRLRGAAACCLIYRRGGRRRAAVASLSRDRRGPVNELSRPRAAARWSQIRHLTEEASPNPLGRLTAMRLTRECPLALVLGVAAIAPAGASDLSLQRVMLSSGGVGYFEYE